MTPQQNLQQTIEYLRQKKRILLLTTSNRWTGSSDIPKSTVIAHKIKNSLKDNYVEIINVAELKIYPCEGNVSGKDGNTCGLLSSKLEDINKNPSGNHRCWASINNPDDELWKISKSLLQSDAVIFLGSVRWGQMNAIYQTLVERLTWLENRHSTLEEDNILENIDAGIIITAHNWNGANVLKTQKQVLSYFGFNYIDEISWFWSFTTSEDESTQGYLDAVKKFESDFSENLM